mmetsp:Transcript_73738/g.123148  ORF Transcript_73738/g.123148 Transcript_73738/m.123148 type:complete len:206 (+) Transcript_73738:321-938(+)
MIPEVGNAYQGQIHSDADRGDERRGRSLQSACNSELLIVVGVVLALEIQQRGLNLLRIFGAEVESPRQADHGFALLAELLVHFAENKIDRAFLWSHLNELFELHKSRVILVHRDKHLSFLEASKRVLRINSDRICEHLECLHRLLIGMQSHPKVTKKRRRARVDGECLAQVMLSEVEFLLAIVNVAEAVPGIVMALIDPNCRSIA